MKDVTLYQGDCLDVLRRLESGSVDAVVTDPPYSSGGMFRGDRAASPQSKYVQTGVVCNGRTVHANFSGDCRDQRSWAYWCALWVSECYRIVKPSGYFLMFADWRQLATACDALQAGGFVWRGIIVWDKTEGARPPHTGYFRHQCEYIAWGTKGGSCKAPHGPWPGCFRFPVRQSDKYHMTGKPTPLMSQLVECVSPKGTVLDPFMGSGTTGVVCVQTERKFIGVEIDSVYFAIAKKRIAAASQKAEAATQGGPLP